jgi:PAS domain S-box-containing protein
MTRQQVLQITIVILTAAIAIVDIAMSSDLMVARLFSLPLALCVFQSSIPLLAGTTAVAGLSTAAAGFLIHFRAAGDWTDAANRGLLLASLLVFSIFIYVVMRNVRLRLGDAARIKAMSEELAARNAVLAENNAGLTATNADLSARIEAERALRIVEESHRMAVEVAEMGTWLWKLPSDEITWSPEFGRLFGLPADAVLTYDAITAHIHPEDKPKIDAAINGALEKNIPYDIQYRIIWPDGQVRWLVARGRVHRDADGKPIDMQGVIMDVTARIESEKTLRLAEERHRMAVEVADMGTWTWNIATGEIDWSEEYRRLFGFSPDEPITRPIVAARIMADDMPQIDAAVKATLESGRPYDVEYRIMLPDGSIRWLVSRGRLHRSADGAPQDMQGVIMDITERKQVQLLVAQREAEARRAEALARSNEELQQFAYIAAHDLQEPLRMVASYTQLIGQRYKGKLDADADDFIEFAVDGARRMQALISDLLAYCRVETAGKPLAEVSSREAFDEAVRNLEGTVADNDAVILCDQLPRVMADRTQLIQLFQNLVGNAIKYRTPERPEVHVSANRGDGNEWIFSVRDNGIGIDPKYSERIFLMFQRLHSRDEYSGTGIGLTLCKKIAERHGGRIWVEPNTGPGSTFHVALPERVLQ